MRSNDPGDSIQRHLEWWPAPAAPETPDGLNGVAVRQFRQVGAAAPAAVLVLSPGFTGGINDLEYVATELTAAVGDRLQVWTTERRNNRLEDARGMEIAEAAGDPRAALGYYFGGDPPGYAPVAQETVAFMRHWGLAVALADLRVVVRRARETVGAGGKVFLGGHSLGGMLGQCYAAWEFPEGPGYGEIDGLVLIDGAVGGPAWTRTTGMAQYETGARAAASGEFYWDDPTRGATPRLGILGQIAALAAALPEWRDRPSVIAPLVPDLFALPPGTAVTNEAALGLVIDAETGPISTYRAHVGRLAVVSGDWVPFSEAGEWTDLHRVASAMRQYDGANGMEWYASRMLNTEVDLSSNLDSRHRETAALAGRHGLRLLHHGREPIPVFGMVTGSEEQKRERYEWYAGTVATEDVTIIDAPEQEHLDPLFAENDGRSRFLPAVTDWLRSRIQSPHE